MHPTQSTPRLWQDRKIRWLTALCLALVALLLITHPSLDPRNVREVTAAEGSLVSLGLGLGLVGMLLLLARRHLASQRQAAQTLWTQNQLLEAAVNFTPAAMSLIRGSDLRILMVNPAYQAIGPSKVMVGKTLNELWPETQYDFSELCRGVLATGEPHHAVDQKFMLCRSRGGPVEPAYFTWSLYRVPLPGDEGWGLLNTVQETTEHMRAKGELREREERLRIFFDHAPAALAMFDRQMRYLNASRRWRSDYGLGERDLRGMSHYEVFPEIGEEWKRVHQRALGGEIIRAESDRFVRADGQVQWLRWELRPWHDAAGAIGGIVIFTEDITEITRAAEQARESAQWLQLAQDAASAGTWQWDLRTNENLWSDELWKLYGLEKQSCLPSFEAWREAIIPEDRERAEHTVREVAERGSELSVEFRVRWADGALHHLLGRGRPQLDAAGRPVRYLGIVIDITERRQAEEEIREINRSLEARVRARTFELEAEVAERRRAEEALRESEERLERAQAMAHLGSWELDLASRRLAWSDEVYRILGLEQRESGATYETFLEHVQPDDRAVVDALYTGALHEGAEVHEVEHYVVRHSTSDLRIVHEKCQHVRDESGRVVRSVGMILDVTELRRAEERMRFLVDAGISLTDALTEEEMLRNAAAMVARRYADYCVAYQAEEDGQFRRVAVVGADARKQELVDALSLCKPSWGAEERTQWSGGSLRDGRPTLIAQVTDAVLGAMSTDEQHLHALRALELGSVINIPLVASGRLIGGLSLARTDRHMPFEAGDLETAGLFGRRVSLALDNVRLYAAETRARAAAERANEELRAVQSVADAALGSLEPDLLFREVLGRLRAALRVDSATILLLDEEGDALVPRASVGLEEEVAEGTRVPLGRGIAGRIAARRSLTLIEDITRQEVFSAALRRKVQSLMGVPLISEGRVLGVVHVGSARTRRFTEGEQALLRLAAERISLGVARARAYEAERKAREKAQEADAAKDQMVALVSHELRNPLVPITAGVQVLRRTLPEDSRARRILASMDRSARLMTRMVNDLLDLSRLVQGKLQLAREPVGLDSVVREVSEVYQRQAGEAGLTLETQVQPDLWVFGDRDRLQQLLSNLLTNALKFTPPPGRLSVSLRRVWGMARLEVADTGVGIAPELMGRLFKSFAQGGGAWRREAGLGLGLALVRTLTEMHGGRVWAESEGVGKGSRFIVELPVFARAGAARPATEASAKRARPVRALLVEESPDARSLLADDLTQRGYEVVAAASGEEGLEFLCDVRPEVLLTDLRLPGMDGREFVRRVRQMPELAEVPAFAVTGYGEVRDVEHALDAGFNGHFTKPADTAVLDQRIRELMGEE